MKHTPHRLTDDVGLRAMALFLIAALVIELALEAWGPESTLVKEYRQVLARALHEPAPELLVMGDSVARGSVLTKTVAEQIGQPISIRNDAMQGTGPEVAYFALRREIAAGKVPKAILYAPSPHTFSTTRMHIAAGGFCSWGEMLDLLWHNPDRMDVVGGAVLRLSYTLRYREQIAELVKGRRQVLALFRDPMLDEDAWVRFCEQEVARRKPVDFAREAIRPQFREPFSVAPVNRYYLERFLDLAAAHAIRVYWAIPPCQERLYQCREQSGFNAEYYRFLDDLAARGLAVLLQREFPVYPDDCFYDQNHFGVPASRRFSADLGLRLRAALLGTGQQLAAPERRDEVRRRAN